MADQSTRGDARDRPVPELMRDLADQTTSLVRKEFELAKLELSEKGKKAGMGAGMFAAAALFGAGAFATLTTCLIRLLDTVVAGWLSALIITVVYGAIAAVVALPDGRAVVSFWSGVCGAGVPTPGVYAVPRRGRPERLMRFSGRLAPQLAMWGG